MKKPNPDQSAISSRVRFARNLAEYPFPGRLSDAGKGELRELIRQAFFGANSAMAEQYDYLDMDTLPPAQRAALIERHLISPAFADGKKGRGLIVDKAGSLSIMIHEEDHLRIQAFAPGLALDEAYRRASQVDRLFCERLKIAQNEKLGYLTACHTNLGTGMRASVMLHLPAVTATGALRDLINETGRLGVTVRGNFGEGSGSSAELYQLSNMFTLGVTEQEILTRTQEIIKSVMAQEERLAQSWYNADTPALEDKIFRAQAVLNSARILDSAEFERLYSLLRLGTSLGLLPYDTAALDALYQSVRPALLALNVSETRAADSAGRPLTGAAARDRLRADIVRKTLKNKNDS